MKYISVSECAKLWDISERTVRNYCAQGKIDGAFLNGKSWQIPENSHNPKKVKNTTANPLLKILKEEKSSGLHGGIYHKIQIELTYNSNHIEGSRLTHDQTRFIFETNTIGIEETAVNIDDIVETANHFKCIDLVIENASRTLSEHFIKGLHRTLKSGTSDSRKGWFAVGEYKNLPNEVGGKTTTEPEDVEKKIKELIKNYNSKKEINFDDLLDFHYQFERIHPFQDGNGRVGRLILFKECLKHNIVPFIIDDDLKLFYYRGLSNWTNEKGYLRDTCLTAQDRFKEYLRYFRIPFDD